MAASVSSKPKLAILNSNVILTIIFVLIIFSALVIAHEFGHFIVAKRNGIRVNEFGIGFPPKLFGIQKGETLYTVNLLPLGGFVQLEGEDNASKSKTSFATKSLWVKTKVLMAGVAMNFLIAYIIFMILCAVGMANILPFSLPRLGPIAPIAAEQSRLVIFSIGKDSAAEKNGLQTSDQIISIAGLSPRSEQDLRAITSSRAGQEVMVTYAHNGDEQTKSIRLGQDGERGILGVVAMPQQRERYPWWQVPIAALLVMGKLVVATVVAFVGAIWTLVSSFKVADTVAGPVGVTAVFGQVVKFGWDYVFTLIASISLSLAVVNVLPIPALDGGRLFILVLRRLGVPIKESQENWAHTVGFVLLIGFGIIVAVSDVGRFF